MKILRGFLLLMMASAVITTASAQKKDKKMSKDSVQAEKIALLLASKQFVFTADFASPERGGSVQLTKYFYLEINPDEIVSFLPVYSDTYSTASSLETNLKISSKTFDYSSVKTANGHWYISIKPKDSSQTVLNLDVANDGTAGLMIASNTRGRMTYTGTIGKKEDN